MADGKIGNLVILPLWYHGNKFSRRISIKIIVGPQKAIEDSFKF